MRGLWAKEQCISVSTTLSAKSSKNSIVAVWVQVFPPPMSAKTHMQ